MARILIVDDEVNIRKLYKSELEDEGYDVVTAASGAEALQLLRDAAPDLVILDIKLEQENGLDFLRHMMDVRPSLSVILNSAYSTYKDDFSSWYLLERITRARVMLEDMNAQHKETCPYMDDTGWPAPCTCGAEERNAKVTAVLRELRIAPDKIRMG